MKKFYAILLGLALTLGFASVASAAFTIAGQFVVESEAYFEEDYFQFYGPYYDSGTRFEVKLTGAYGAFSGDATFRFTAGSSAVFRSGKILWAASDEVKLGVVSSDAGTVYYTSPVDQDEWKYDFVGWEYGVLVEDTTDPGPPQGYDTLWYVQADDEFDYSAYAKAELTFGDFKADIFANGYYEKAGDEKLFQLWVFGDLEYAMDPFTFYLPYDVKFFSVADDPAGAQYGAFEASRFDLELYPTVKYAISDEFYVAAELEIDYWSSEDDLGSASEDESFEALAVGADYETDLIHLYGSFDWDFSAEEVDWWLVGVEFFMNETMTLYAEADYDEVLLLGFEWNMDGAEKVMLVVEAETNFEFDYLDILATWTFKM